MVSATLALAVAQYRMGTVNYMLGLGAGPTRGAPIVPGARWNLLPPGTLTRRAYTAT